MAAGAGKLSVTQGRVLSLLALSVLINYIDRANLSIAAPLLKNELGLSASQLGLLFSAFFATYAAFQLVSGWLVDRFDVSWVLGLGFFFWSAATVTTGFIRGFAMLLALRLVLGIGESVAYPSYSKILACHFLEHQRGFANAAITTGLALGPAFGMFGGGILMADFGWRRFFIGFGILSLAWLLPWARWKPRPQPVIVTTTPCPKIADILKQRSAWGTCVGGFSLTYVLYFLLTWLPYYLVHERRLSMHDMARVGGGFFLCVAIGAMISGWVSDRMIAAGATATSVRKSFMAVGQALGSAFLLSSVVTTGITSTVLLFISGLALSMAFANMWAITQTLAGTNAAGRWTGVQNFCGNLSGIVAPALTGMIVDRTGRFFPAFALTAAVVFAGVAAWVFFVGPVKEVRWAEPILVRAAEASADAA
jgi:MFS family permease